jgi:hypothetical protein
MLECCMIKAMHHNILVIQVFIQGIYIYNIRTLSKKSLNIPKEYSESVNRRRTGNTMATRKRTNTDL